MMNLLSNVTGSDKSITMKMNHKKPGLILRTELYIYLLLTYSTNPKRQYLTSFGMRLNNQLFYKLNL